MLSSCFLFLMLRRPPRSTLFPYTTLSDLKLFGGGQKAASGGIQGDVLATDNNTVGMGDAGSIVIGSKHITLKIGRAVQQECRDRCRMPSSAGKKKGVHGRPRLLGRSPGAV